MGSFFTAAASSRFWIIRRLEEHRLSAGGEGSAGKHKVKISPMHVSMVSLNQGVGKAVKILVRKRTNPGGNFLGEGRAFENLGRGLGNGPVGASIHGLLFA